MQILPDMDRLFYRSSNYFLPIPSVANNGIIIHGPGLAINTSLKDLLTFLDLVPEDNFLGDTEEL